MDKSFEKLINRVLDGRYKIESVVGIGGMAYVLLASDMQNGNRPVAVKVLNEEFNKDENAVKRFVNESEMIAMVDSPNIVKIYDVAISDNLKYIVMEYIDGITLKDYMDKVGSLGWKEAVHYVRQILTGISHAHEKGIIHRDIKPQNVMLLRDGRVKVTDFGIAKSPTSENLTMTDKAIGTVNYISPEQASGGPVDKKSDVYSVGVMLYEMLTGKLPFVADSPVAVAMMQVNETPVPPRELNPQIPIGLEQIVLKAMSKKPEERFNCAMSMEKALEYFVKNPGTVFSSSVHAEAKENPKRKKREKPKKRRSMFTLIAGITAVFFALIIGIVVFALYSGGGMSGNGIAATLDKILGIESKNSEDKKMSVESFVGLVYNDETVKQIEAKGYHIESIKKTGYSDVDDGTIVNQKPEAGEIIIKKENVGITLYVNENKTGANNKMPDCIGSPKKSAIEQLVRKFGPNISEEDIEVIEEFNETHAAGTVYECIPQVGKEFDIEKDTITIYVSKGKKMKMPEVVGLTENEAIKLLDDEQIEYFVEYVEDEGEPGIVLEADVEAGAEVLEEDSVTVKVSKKSFSRHNNDEKTEKNNEDLTGENGENSQNEEDDKKTEETGSAEEEQNSARGENEASEEDGASEADKNETKNNDTPSVNKKENEQNAVDSLLNMRGEA